MSIPADLLRLLDDPEEAERVNAGSVPFLLVQAAAHQARLTAVEVALAARLALTSGTGSGTGDRLLTIAEVAERMHLSRGHIYRHAENFPFLRRQGRALRFSENGLLRWLAERRR